MARPVCGSWFTDHPTWSSGAGDLAPVAALAASIVVSVAALRMAQDDRRGGSRRRREPTELAM
jgi:hypothetical protein